MEIFGKLETPVYDTDLEVFRVKQYGSRSENSNCGPIK